MFSRSRRDKKKSAGSRNDSLGDMYGGPQIAELEQRLGLVDQDVVGLDVGVDDVALSEQLERKQELLRVGPHGVDVDTHVLAVLFQHL